MRRLAWLLVLLVGCPSATIYIRDKRSNQQWYYDDHRDDGTPDPDGVLTDAASRSARAHFRDVLKKSEFGDLRSIHIEVNQACLDGAGGPATNAHGGYADGQLYVDFCDNSPSLDVMGHEFMHGFIDLLVGSDIYPYTGETGAIEEGIADLFGELTECARGGPCDWINGTDTRAPDPACSLGCAAPDYCCDLTNGCPADYQLCNTSIYSDTAPPTPFRDLANPVTNQRPVYYLGLDWGWPLPVCDDTNDNCYVHQNSGVFNVLSYLLVMGGTRAGITVKPAPSFPRAILDLVRTGTNFPILASSYSALATSLPAYADAEDREAITNAFCAVGLPLSASGCRDLDGDGIVERADNCKQFWNTEQTDTDHDGVGDACDDDIDNDGRPNTLDLCPEDYDPVPTDSDGDGVPDACDPDIDGDQHPNTDDNCPRAPNPDQADLDLDGVGDVCDRDRDGDCVVDTVDHCPTVVSACPNRAAICDPCAADLQRLAHTIVAYVAACARRGEVLCASSGCPGGSVLGRILATLDAGGLTSPELGGRRVFVRGDDGEYRLDPSVVGPAMGGPAACTTLEQQLTAMEAKLAVVVRACAAARDRELQACNPATCP